MPTSLLKLPIRLTASYLRLVGGALRGLAELIDSDAGADAADTWTQPDPGPDRERPEPVPTDPGADSPHATPRPRARRGPTQRRPSPTEPGSGRARRPAREEQGPPAPPTPGASQTQADVPPPSRQPGPPQPAPLDGSPGHVSEEAVLVRESADPGATDGAGPEIHVEEPWHGYGALSAADVVDRLASEPDSAVALVQLYEQTHRHRRTVLDAAGRELRRRNPPGSGSSDS